MRQQLCSEHALALKPRESDNLISFLNTEQGKVTYTGTEMVLC